MKVCDIINFFKTNLKSNHFKVGDIVRVRYPEMYQEHYFIDKVVEINELGIYTIQVGHWSTGLYPEQYIRFNRFTFKHNEAVEWFSMYKSN